MTVKIHLPIDLRKMAGGQRMVEVEACTARDAIAALEALYPGLWDRLYDEKGKWRSVYLFLINDKNAFGAGMPGGSTPLRDTDEVMIVYFAMGG
jgi:molybdopterin converting factor small subunit